MHRPTLIKCSPPQCQNRSDASDFVNRAPGLVGSLPRSAASSAASAVRRLTDSSCMLATSIFRPSSGPFLWLVRRPTRSDRVPLTAFVVTWKLFRLTSRTRFRDTLSEVTLQSLWSRYDRHFVGIARYSALS